MPFYLQVIVLLVVTYFALSEGVNVYYITANKDGTCIVNKTDLSPCYTLQQLVKDEVLKASKADSAELVLLSGTHLGIDFNISNFSSVAIHPLAEEQEVVINCEVNSSSFTLYNITKFSLSAVRFISCSLQYSYEHGSTSERSISITRCVFQRSRKAVVISSTKPTLSILISECSFANSNDTAISVSKPIISTTIEVAQLSIVDTLFEDHWSSAINIKFTRLTIWSSHFVNNREANGGAIFGSASNLNISDSIFSDNWADQVGGALSLKDCSLAIDNCDFVNNSAGINGGAVALQAVSFSTLSFVYIRHCIMQENYAAQYGGALIFLKVYGTIADSQFERNSASVGGALFLQGGREYFEARNSTFYSNRAKVYGGAFFCKDSSNITIEGGWSATNYAEGDGGFAYLSHCKVYTVQEVYNISYNEALNGGAVYAEDGASIDMVDGGLLANNFARGDGGALYLRSSHLNLYNVSILLQFNHANSRGGAIFVQDEECEKDYNFQCFIANVSAHANERVVFSKNTAPQGPILYGGFLDRCCFATCQVLGINAIKSIFKYNPTPLAITSDPNKVCLCTADLKPECNKREFTLTRMRGQTVQLVGSVVDDAENPRPSFIRARYNDSVGILGEGEGGVTTESKCRNLSYHIFTASNSATLFLQPEGICERSKVSRLTLNIELIPCSEGFEKHKDRCVCERRLSSLFGDNIVCDIDSNTIRMKDTIWLEYNDQYLKVRPSCPLDYCQADSNTIHLTRPADEQCANNRSGVLCGSCRTNFSIALGGSKCLQCASNYAVIWLIPVFAVAGIVLVAFLLVLNLTVSHGTSNGLIFYANVISIAGLTNIRGCTISPALSVFIAWINLDFGVETCFYSGMDTYQKTWLQFAFPLYIWLLVTAITIASHYSATATKVFGRNNIAILATLFLLSYTKILKTIITALDFTNVLQGDATNISDPLVPYKAWTHDGSLDYLKGRHIPLFAVSLMLLIFLFLPYTLLLTFGQCLRSIKTKRRRLQGIIHSTAFISIMDAYHAPYNKRHRYWTGFMLLTRCALFLVFTFSYSDDPLVMKMYITTIAAGGVLGLKICIARMYRNFFVSLLELSFVFNLFILSATLTFLGTGNSYLENAVCKCISTSIAVSLVIFIGIIIYHTHLQLDKKKCYISLKQFLVSKANVTSNYREIDEVAQNPPKLPTSSTVELREELLES